MGRLAAKYVYFHRLCPRGLGLFIYDPDYKCTIWVKRRVWRTTFGSRRLKHLGFLGDIWYT